MNWSGFADGFSDGFRNGMAIGNSIKDAMKQKKFDDIRAKGIEEAQALRQARVEKSIQDNGEQPAQPATAPTQAPMPAPAPVDPEAHNRMVPPEMQAVASAQPAAPTMPAAQGISAPAQKRFSVGGQGFDTREEAVRHAEKQAPSIMDFMAKTMVPRMQQALVEQGDIEKAEAWGKWAEDRQNKRHMQEWAKAYTAAQSGNMERAADHVFNLYKDFDDGVTPVSKEVVKDKAGNVTGFNVKLKDDSTGEVRSQFISPQNIVEMGLSGLSPVAMFEQAYKRQNEASALAAKARIDAQNDARTAAREEARDVRTAAREDARDERRAAREAKAEEVKHGYRLEELATKEELEAAGITTKEKAKVKAKVDILRESGVSPEAIKELLPHMVGGDGYKRSTSPEEARRLLMTERVKDPLFNLRPAAEQKAILDQDMVTIYGQPTATPRAAPAPTTPSAAKPQGIPVFDTKTGQIIYR